MNAACATDRELEDLLDERLTPDLLERLDLHFRECPVCVVRLDRITRRREAAELPSLVAPEPTCKDAMPTPAPPSDDTELEIPAGTSVGPYDLVRELGRGGMGIVYEARHRTTNRVSALKVLATPLLANPAGAARFAAEVRAMNRLKHPGIVEVHDAGVWAPGHGQPPIPYAALELVPGPSLKAVLADGPLEIAVASELVGAIARAVHHAHEKGVVHRDLKPANILLSGCGSLEMGCGEDQRGTVLPTSHQQRPTPIPKVTDFGLAKLLDESCGLTASRDVLGTPEYMAPELGEPDRPIGPAADVYALGVILFECITGQVPFRSTSPLRTLLVARSRRSPVPSRLRADVPRELDAIILQCLEKEPDDRYPSAEALADALDAFHLGAARPAPARTRRRVALAGLVVAALAAIAAVAMSGKPPSVVPTADPPPVTPAPPITRVVSYTPAPPKPERLRVPKPTEFASVFTLGYWKDEMPQDAENFDKLVAKLKEGGFNVVHCSYTDARLKACEKHGMKMMVDLLAAEHHIYKEPDAAKELCVKLRGERALWGYNIWNDTIGKTADGRMRDIANVRTWDPTHPAYCGTYKTDGIAGVTNADVGGYYDYHWKRNRDGNFPHLLSFAAWARERDAIFLRWVEADPGLAGKGNMNRARYTLNTSIACGAKGVLWFLGNKQLDIPKLEWTPLGKDAVTLNAEVAPLRGELMKIGNPVAVYSTPISKTANNDPLPSGKKSMLPLGLERVAFPAAFWVKPVAGEFVCGVFQDRTDKAAPDRLFIANHNAYLDQEVTLTLPKPRKAWQFARKGEKWEPLEVKAGRVTFKLAAGGGELLRFE